MLRVAVLVVCFSIMSGSTQAGAWLREKGTAFTSSSFVTNKRGDGSTMTYLEYGVLDNLTVGADLMVSYTNTGRQFGFGTLFLRRPIGDAGRNRKFAYQLGIGAAWDNLLILPHIEAGLSWGRGLKLGKIDGWATIDSSFRWEPTLSRNHLKVDGTIGLSLGKHTKVMVQMFTENKSGALTSTLAPSVLISPGKGTYTLQVGVELPDGQNDPPRLKLGIWRKF
ncbi:MAG: hypothetical protein WBC93_02330 [Sulfitobacter sp.]